MRAIDTDVDVAWSVFVLVATASPAKRLNDRDAVWWLVDARGLKEPLLNVGADWRHLANTME